MFSFLNRLAVIPADTAFRASFLQGKRREAAADRDAVGGNNRGNIRLCLTDFHLKVMMILINDLILAFDCRLHRNPAGKAARIPELHIE